MHSLVVRSRVRTWRWPAVPGLLWTLLLQETRQQTPPAPSCGWHCSVECSAEEAIDCQRYACNPSTGSSACPGGATCVNDCVQPSTNDADGLEAAAQTGDDGVMGLREGFLLYFYIAAGAVATMILLATLCIWYKYCGCCCYCCCLCNRSVAREQKRKQPPPADLESASTLAELETRRRKIEESFEAKEEERPLRPRRRFLCCLCGRAAPVVKQRHPRAGEATGQSVSRASPRKSGAGVAVAEGATQQRVVLDGWGDSCIFGSAATTSCGPAAAMPVGGRKQEVVLKDEKGASTTVVKSRPPPAARRTSSQGGAAAAATGTASGNAEVKKDAAAAEGVRTTLGVTRQQIYEEAPARPDDEVEWLASSFSALRAKPQAVSPSEIKKQRIDETLCCQPRPCGAEDTEKGSRTGRGDDRSLEWHDRAPHWVSIDFNPAQPDTPRSAAGPRGDDQLSGQRDNEDNANSIADAPVSLAESDDGLALQNVESTEPDSAQTDDQIALNGFSEIDFGEDFRQPLESIPEVSESGLSPSADLAATACAIRCAAASEEPVEVAFALPRSCERTDHEEEASAIWKAKATQSFSVLSAFVKSGSPWLPTLVQRKKPKNGGDQYDDSDCARELPSVGATSTANHSKDQSIYGRTSQESVCEAVDDHAGQESECETTEAHSSQQGVCEGSECHAHQSVCEATDGHESHKSVREAMETDAKQDALCETMEASTRQEALFGMMDKSLAADTTESAVFPSVLGGTESVHVCVDRKMCAEKTEETDGHATLESHTPTHDAALAAETIDKLASCVATLERLSAARPPGAVAESQQAMAVAAERLAACLSGFTGSQSVSSVGGTRVPALPPTEAQAPQLVDAGAMQLLTPRRLNAILGQLGIAAATSEPSLSEAPFRAAATQPTPLSASTEFPEVEAEPEAEVEIHGCRLAAAAGQAKHENMEAKLPGATTVQQRIADVENKRLCDETSEVPDACSGEPTRLELREGGRGRGRGFDIGSADEFSEGGSLPAQRVSQRGMPDPPPPDVSAEGDAQELFQRFRQLASGSARAATARGSDVAGGVPDPSFPDVSAEGDAKELFQRFRELASDSASAATARGSDVASGVPDQPPPDVSLEGDAKELFQRLRDLASDSSGAATARCSDGGNEV